MERGNRADGDRVADPAPGGTPDHSGPIGRLGRLLGGWAGRLVALGVVGAGVGLAAAHRTDLPVERLEHRYADGPDDFLDVAGMRVHYRDEGPHDAGPPLVCLHGTFASLHTWDGWTAALTDDHRLVRPDLPGHGLTGPHPETDYSMAAYVDFLAAFLDRLGIEECVVAGNSRGGAIAWRFALDHPDRVAGLVLVDAMGFPLEVPGLSAVVDVPVLPRLLSRLTPRRLVRRNLEDVYGDPEAVPPELVTRYHDLLRREGNRDALVELLRRDADPTHRHGELSTLTAPTLVQWGSADRWIPPWHGERFAATIPDARLVTYDGLGHAPMEEAPARTAADVQSFLGERVSRPKTALD